MASLRTEESEKIFQEFRKTGKMDSSCALCEKEPVKQFEHWKIVTNDFPYDRLASVHHMIVPLRHIQEKEFNQAEKDEIAALKETYLNTEYEYIIEATRKKKSIPGHFHYHLIVAS